MIRLVLVLLLGLTAWASGAWVIRVVGSSVTATLDGDTYVRGGTHSGTNYDSSGAVQFKHDSDATFIRHVVFSFTDCPSSHSAATLKLTQRNTPSSTFTITYTIKYKGSTTDETTATYTSVSGASWTTLSTGVTLTSDSPGYVHEIDVTGVVPSGGGDLSIWLEGTSQDTVGPDITFEEKETEASLAAELVFD